MTTAPTLDPAALPSDDDAAIAALRQLQTLPHAQAQPVLRHLVVQARDAGRARVQGHALCLLARSLGLADDVPAAEAAASEALAVFEALGDAGGQATARNAVAMLRFAQGDHAAALDQLTQALALARPLGDAGVLCGLLNGLGTALNAVGDPQGAALAYEECMALLPPDPSDLRHIGVRHNLAMALACWAERDRDAGVPSSAWLPRAEQAVQLAESSMADGLAAGHGEVLSGQDSLALALLMAGQPARALEVLERPEVKAAERVSTLDALHLSRTRARALTELGRLTEAVAVCEAALRQARAMGTELHTDAILLTLSLAHEAAGDHRQALAAHRQFHAARERLVFERAQRSARTMAAQVDLVRAQRESRLDPLTGIANRRGFVERALARLARARADEPLSLLLIDIDHFKQVNDTQGHAAGDRLLCALADVLRASCRGTEPPARLGGDEFVVLVEGGPREAHALAQRVRDALGRLRAQATADDAAVPACTVSIGLASVVGPCALDVLMSRADSALYAVKHGGRDGVAEAAVS